jgi:hypothetical protein
MVHRGNNKEVKRGGKRGKMGVNKQGNVWRSFRGNAYDYSNRDGSYYYNNGRGNTYYEKPVYVSTPTIVSTITTWFW